MKDDTSTPMLEEGTSPNQFEYDKPGTGDRTCAEAAIEDLRQRGGFFAEAVRATRMPMVLTDPNLPGNPIVFANDSFLKLSGYSMDEVLGQQPYFMNGPETDTRDAGLFRDILDSGHDGVVETVQYAKDGRRFVATVLLSAFKDDDGKTLHHFLSWGDVTRRVEAEAEVDDLRKAQAALRESERLRSAMLEVLPVGLGLMDCEGRVLLSNPEWARFIPSNRMPSRDPERQARWRSWNEDGSPVDPQDFPGARALRGEHVVPPMEFLYTHDDGKEIWTSVAAVPLLDDRQKVTGVVAIIQDIDSAKRAVEALKDSEQHARLLLAELQHRVRNIVAMIRSLVRRSRSSGANVEHVIEHLEGRIDALARTQAMLTRSPGAGVDLENLVREELTAHAPDWKRIRLAGPDIALSAKTAELLTIAVHELATNSVKYGALAGSGGTIIVDWARAERGGGDWLELEWREIGISPEANRHEGFGTELITRRIPYEAGGTGAIHFEETAMTVRIEIPLRAGESSLDPRANGDAEWSS